VVYIALEGGGGISKRIKAGEARYKKPVQEQVRFLLGNFTLLDKRDTELEAARRPRKGYPLHVNSRFPRRRGRFRRRSGGAI